MPDKITTKKQLSTQLTIEEEREQLKKDIEAWKKEKQEKIKMLEEYNKQNPDGKIYNCWFDDTCSLMKEMFLERAIKIFEREKREKEQQQ